MWPVDTRLDSTDLDHYLELLGEYLHINFISTSNAIVHFLPPTTQLLSNVSCVVQNAIILSVLQG